MQTKLFQAIAVNLLYMLGMILFIRPFLSADDYLMAMNTYGVVSGEYDYHSIYENINYGRIIVWLQSIFEQLPCYTLMFYLLVFSSLIILTYYILSWNNRLLGWSIINIILLFFSYEGYVAIQFTKVAGIAGGVGIILLLLPYVPLIMKFVGVLLFTFSCLIRINVAQSSIAIWGVALVILLLINVCLKKKRDAKTMLKVGIGFLVCVSLYIIVPFIPKYSSSEEQKLWIEYWTWNNVRVNVQDYNYPDYEENKEIYQKIGVSENDLYIWHEWNTDVEALTLEKGLEISKMQPKNDDLAVRFFKISNIKNFLKRIPLGFLNIDVFLAYIILVMLLIFSDGWCRKHSKLYVLICSAIPFLMAYYYLFIGERYFQHRVDVALLFNVCCIAIFYILNYEKELQLRKDKPMRLATILLVILITLFTGRYAYWEDDKPHSKEAAMKLNRTYYEHTSKDAEHYYVTVNQRYNTKARVDAFYALEVMPKGFMKNIISGYDVYSRYLLDKRGIGYPFTKLIDNDDMYLVMAINNNAEKEWEIYLSERNDTEVKMTLVKNFMDRKMYRATTKSLDEILGEYTLDNEGKKIKSDVSVTLENDRICVGGEAFIEGQDDFAQNVYVVIKDTQSGAKNAYYTLQSENKKYSLAEEGRFSTIDMEIEKPEFFDELDEIYILIENQGKYCAKRIG